MLYWLHMKAVINMYFSSSWLKMEWKCLTVNVKGAFNPRNIIEAYMCKISYVYPSFIFISLLPSKN